MSSTPGKDYEITKDPFAIFSFALLVSTIALFLFLLIVTARRSSIEVWNSLSRRAQSRSRRSDHEYAREDPEPLINSQSTLGTVYRHSISADLKHDTTTASKRVRFSEAIDLSTIPIDPDAFDETFDKWHTTNTRDNDAGSGKRKSISERQLAELCLAST